LFELRLKRFAAVGKSAADQSREMMSPTNTRVFGIEKYGETLVVTPQGDATGFRYVEIHQDTNAICDLVGREKVENLIIDLRDVKILGSIIISSIIKMARKISEKQGQACFCQAGDSMREVIHSMSLTKLWPYYDSLDEAISSFSDD
jgi:anti-anti-sigma factor